MINEKIIYSKSLKGIELLRSLAYYKCDVIGLNILTQSSLIERVGGLIGYFPNNKVLSKEEQQFQIYKILEDSHIIDVQTFDDVIHITNTLNEIRNDIDDDSFETFENLKESKNNSIGSKKLFSIYFDYLSYLSENGYLDNVSIVFDYLKHAQKCIHTITLLKEETYTPLDLKLVNAFAENVETISISDLFYNKADKSSIARVNPAYGEYNEIREALSYVVENKIPFDQVNFIFTQENKYFDELYALSEEFKVPVNFVGGVKIIESNPYKLFSFLFDLEDNYFNSVDGYNALFNLPCFDTKDFTIEEKLALIDVMGHLKIGFDKEYNNQVLDRFLASDQRTKVFYKYFKKDMLLTDTFVQKLKAVVEDFSEGIISVVKKHCFFREDDHTVLDQGAIKIIEEHYGRSLNIKSETVRRTYLERLKLIMLISDVSEPGFLNAATLTNTMSLYRPYTFIFGLSSAYFPGKNVENYLISNALLKEINKDSIISDEKILNKIKSLNLYIKLLNELNSEVHLSYSFYSLNDVKAVNPCSIIYSLVNDDDLKKIVATKDVRNNKISGYRGIANIALSTENDLINTSFENHSDEVKNLLDITYSPTGIDTFFKCGKKFYLTKILGLQEEDEYDPFDPIDSLVYGVLFHKAMEYLKNHNKCDVDEFINNGLKLFDDYISYDVPVFDVSIAREDYIHCLANAFQMIKENNLTIVNCEKRLEGVYHGVKLAGTYDALALTSTKTLVLLDYKTGKKIKHEENDVETGRQMMIYFELLKQNGDNVTQGYYIYPRANTMVSMNLLQCDKTSFETKIDDFKEALQNRDFKETKECAFCKFQNLCGKNIKIYER